MLATAAVALLLPSSCALAVMVGTSAAADTCMLAHRHDFITVAHRHCRISRSNRKRARSRAYWLLPLGVMLLLLRPMRVE
jgi:hypothetical protein